jgi:hypothetical protein
MSTKMVFYQFKACSDYLSYAQHYTSWTELLPFVVSILIFEFVYSWIGSQMINVNRNHTKSQYTREYRLRGSYRMKDGCSIMQQNKVDIKQSDVDDKSHNSSVSTSGSTIQTHLDDDQKNGATFLTILKRWTQLTDVKKERRKNSQQISWYHRRYRRVSSSNIFKCHRSRSIRQFDARSRNQYRRDPVTFRNRIENALDRAALWYYVDRRLQKSR